MSTKSPTQEIREIYIKREKGKHMSPKTEIIIASLILITGWSIMISAILITPQYVTAHAFFPFLFVTIWAIFYMQKKLHSLKISQETSSGLTSSPITVKCPYCDTTFQILPNLLTHKPLKVKCPSCGKESMLK